MGSQGPGGHPARPALLIPGGGGPVGWAPGLRPGPRRIDGPLFLHGPPPHWPGCGRAVGRLHLRGHAHALRLGAAGVPRDGSGRCGACGHPDGAAARSGAALARHVARRPVRPRDHDQGGLRGLHGGAGALAPGAAPARAQASCPQEPGLDPGGHGAAGRALDRLQLRPDLREPARLHHHRGPVGAGKGGGLPRADRHEAVAGHDRGSAGCPLALPAGSPARPDPARSLHRALLAAVHAGLRQLVSLHRADPGSGGGANRVRRASAWTEAATPCPPRRGRAVRCGRPGLVHLAQHHPGAGSRHAARTDRGHALPRPAPIHGLPQGSG